MNIYLQKIFVGLSLQDFKNILIIFVSIIMLFLPGYLLLRNKKVKSNDMKNNIVKSKSHILRLKSLLENDQKLSWEDFFSLNFATDVYSDVIYSIKLGIDKGLFFGDFLNNHNAYPFRRIIEEQTLAFFDTLALKSDFEGYSFVEITRSSHKDITIGTYIYKFNDNDNLHLMRVPFRVKTFGSDLCPVFDNELVSNVLVIEKSSIKDFQVFGTQLMQTSINQSNINPDVSTLLSELLFGSSYTILKGISKISLSSSHTIKDVRLVQVIISDKTDLEFSGISIYYEFNRRFGKTKNKEVEAIDKSDNSNNFKDEQLLSNDYYEELRKLKALLDEGILTQHEFDTKKREYLKL